MDESEEKQIRDEVERPQASCGLKTKKERWDNDINTRLSTATFSAPPMTSVASKRREDAPGKALAAEEGKEMSEGGLIAGDDHLGEEGNDSENEGRAEEEKNEAQRTTAAPPVER
jgi:hypothetical protein